MSDAVLTGNERLLVEELRQGNESVFEKIFRNYYPQLCRFAANILKDKSAAEDMVQEVFVKVWDKRNEMLINTSLKAYLFAAVRNHCFNALKLHERNTWLNEDHEDLPAMAVNDTLDKLAAKSLDHKIKSVIEDLPGKCRLTFELSRFENMSYKEIAHAMDVSVKTVENQMGKALFMLRERLRPYLVVVVTLLLGKIF